MFCVPHQRDHLPFRRLPRGRQTFQASRRNQELAKAKQAYDCDEFQVDEQQRSRWFYGYARTGQRKGTRLLVGTGLCSNPPSFADDQRRRDDYIAQFPTSFTKSSEFVQDRTLPHRPSLRLRRTLAREQCRRVGMSATDCSAHGHRARSSQWQLWQEACGDITRCHSQL